MERKMFKLFKDLFIVFILSFLTLSITSVFSYVNAAEGNSSLSIEAWDFYYDKDFDKAIELFNKEAEAHSDWCDPYDGLGWSYMQKGEFKKAEGYFKKCLEIYAYYQNSLAGLAEIEVWKYRQFNRAWNYYYAGNFDKAIGLFNAILSQKEERLPSTESWRIYSGLGWSYYGKKDFDNAVKYFGEVIKVNAKNSDALKGLGFAYFDKGDLNNAFVYLTYSLKEYPYQADVQGKIAWVYSKKGDFKKAIEEFEKIKTQNPYLAEPYKGLAWAYYEMKDYKKAKEAFIVGIKTYPGYVADEKFKEVLKTKEDWKDLYTLLGWSFYNYALYQQAKVEFQDAVKQLGEDADSLRGLGYSQYKLGEFKDVVNNLKKSLSLNLNLPPIKEYVQVPGTIASYMISSDAQSTLGWVLYYDGKYKDSAKEFEGVISRHPDWIDAHDGLGWALYMQKDNKAALKSFNDALTLNPIYADALNGIAAINQIKYGKSQEAWIYYYRGDYKTAISKFNEVLKGSSQFPKEEVWAIHDGMGWSYYWLGDYTNAEKEFRSVLIQVKDNVDALVGLGYVLFQRKNYTQSIDSLKQALKLVPGHYDALKTLGWSNYKIGSYTDAVEAFKKAIVINVYLVDPYLGLALSYYKNNNKKDAKAVLGTAIDIYPDYVLTDEVKDILKKESDWVDLYGRLGWSYYYTGIFDKASDMFAEALNKNPASEDALLGLGSVLYQQGDFKTAISKLQPLLSKKPAAEKGWFKWSAVLTSLGWSNFFTEKYDNALSYFDELLALHKDDNIYAEPYSGRGWCLLKKGNKEAAREEFLKAVKLLPGYISAVNGLAELER